MNFLIEYTRLKHLKSNLKSNLHEYRRCIGCTL